MPDPTVAELVELCTRIQSNAHAIPVRTAHRGRWESLFLSELPAGLAVWWAMQFVLQRLGATDEGIGPLTEVIGRLERERAAAPLQAVAGAGAESGPAIAFTRGVPQELVDEAADIMALLSGRPVEEIERRELPPVDVAETKEKG